MDSDLTYKNLVKYLSKNKFIIESQNCDILKLKYITWNLTYTITINDKFLRYKENILDYIEQHDAFFDKCDDYFLSKSYKYCTITSIITIEIDIYINQKRYSFDLSNFNPNIVNKTIQQKDINNSQPIIDNTTSPKKIISEEAKGRMWFLNSKIINIKSEFNIENIHYKLFIKVQLNNSNLYYLYFYLENLIHYLIKNKPKQFFKPYFFNLNYNNNNNNFNILEQSIIAIHDSFYNNIYEKLENSKYIDNIFYYLFFIFKFNNILHFFEFDEDLIIYNYTKCIENTELNKELFFKSCSTIDNILNKLKLRIIYVNDFTRSNLINII